MRHLKWAVVGLLFSLGALAQSHAQAVWTLRNSVIPGKSFRAVTSTGSMVVAVGDTGAIYTSANGSAWISRVSGATTHFYAVASGGGQVVAVGQAGLIRTSPDGISWTTRSSGVASNLLGIAWIGTQFVAVGANGLILTSPDAITWTQRTTTITATFRSLVWTGSLLIGVGDGGLIATSADGINWQSRVSGTTQALYGAVSGAGLFVVVGNGGMIRTSPDAVTWTQRATTTTAYFTAVARVGNQFVAVGDLGNIFTSPDGITWTAQLSGTTKTLGGLASMGGNIVVVGLAGTVRLSADGITWANPSATTANLPGVTWSAAKGFVAVGDGGTVVTSPDGILWAPRASANTVALGSVAWGSTAGVFVASGNTGTLESSPDAATWTLRTSGAGTNYLYGVSWAGSKFIAVGAGGMIVSSADGVTWAPANSGSGTNALYSVLYNGSNLYVATGAAGTILTSANGSSWAAKTNPAASTIALNSVAYTGSQYVVVGSGGTILTSPNGTTWTSRTSGISTTLYSVTWTGTYLTAVGAGGVILASQDGITWIPQPSGTTSTLYSIVSADSLIVAVGVSGTILSSPKATVPAVPTLTAPAQAATGVSVYGNLNWSAASGATYYRVQISTDSTFPSMVVNDTLSATSWSAMQLAGTTLYYWRVAGVNSLGQGAFSTIRKFTTGIPPTAAPLAPVLTSPEMFAENLAVPVTFVWQAAGGTDTYRIQVSTSSGFTGTVADDSNFTATTRAVSGLAGGVEYYWRVRGKNGLGAGAWSEVRAFKTLLAPPAAPTLLTPTNLADTISRATSVTWSAVAGVSVYQVQIGTDAGMTAITAQDSTLTGLSFKPTSLLAANTPYYWRVRAKNGAGWGPWSSLSRFTTGTSTALLPGSPRTAQFFRAAGGEYLRFSLKSPEKVVVRLYDMHGRLAATLLNGPLAAGIHTLALPRDLGASLHVLEFRAGSVRELQTILP